MFFTLETLSSFLNLGLETSDGYKEHVTQSCLGVTNIAHLTLRTGI